MRLVVVNAITNEIVNIVEGEAGFEPGAGFASLEAPSDATIGDVWDGTNLHKGNPVAEESREVSDLQFRLALSASGLRESAESYVEAASAQTRDFWDRALVVPRHHWFVEEMAQALALGESELDALFASASQF